jgi:uncharacterized membrane protein YccC
MLAAAALAWGWVKGKLGGLLPLLLALGLAVLGLLSALRRADRRAATAEARADTNAEAVRQMETARKERDDAENRIRALGADDAERRRLRERWTDRGG